MPETQDAKCGRCGKLIEGSGDDEFVRTPEFCGYIRDDRHQFNGEVKPAFCCRKCSDHYFDALDAELRTVANRHALNLGARQADAEDATQSSLDILARHLLRGHSKEILSSGGLQPRRLSDYANAFKLHVPWLLGIVRMKWREHLRKEERRPTPLSSMPTDYRTIDDVTPSINRRTVEESSPLSFIIRSEEAALVRDQLDTLPDHQRVALIRWKLKGEKAETVAREMGYADVSSVYKAAREGIETLRRRIKAKIAENESRERDSA